MNKIIVSMTSYPKRICNVSISINLLLTKLTIKPDEIHLWLAIEEFPDKENNLPKDLIKILENEKCKLHWVLKNTYCHKRHEIFKYTNDNDLVFLLDDDVEYNSKLIETVINVNKEHPNAIVLYHNYSNHVYNGKRNIYTPDNLNITYKECINKFRWCGQSMIPSKVYPKEILNDYYCQIRDKYSPMSDECWFTPFTVLYDIPLIALNFDWGKDINKDIPKENGLCLYTHLIEPNGLERRDNWLYLVLKLFPKIYKKYQSLFNYDTETKIIDDYIIVALTTWTKRINNIPHIIDLIMANTMLPNKICINLAIDDFQNKESDFPLNVIDKINLYQDIIEINWLSNNTKVWKKLIPTLCKYLDAIVISIDDDFEYPNDIIETLYNEYCKYDKKYPISGNKVHMFGMNCHCGSGSLTTYKLLNNKGLFDTLTIEAANSDSDDIFYSYCALINGNEYKLSQKMFSDNMKPYNLNNPWSALGHDDITKTYRLVKSSYENNTKGDGLEYIISSNTKSSSNTLLSSDIQEFIIYDNDKVNEVLKWLDEHSK